ncbi:MAG: RagB/SusD family nutrient uptake outer membrane protein, partial [Muribaculaceae bacterium]|nr:RagB/SusD family nutrient uptake outer membrane protein [Muribaculaceae bacterium]
FMSEMRRERAVELSYEGHRFNDLRRWLLLTEPRYADKTSHEFDRAGKFDANSPEKNQVSNLREVVIVHREYGNKHYWLPLKKKDVNMSVDFPQNPGW